jgi:hypothetical protein
MKGRAPETQLKEGSPGRCRLPGYFIMHPHDAYAWVSTGKSGSKRANVRQTGTGLLERGTPYMRRKEFVSSLSHHSLGIAVCERWERFVC